VKWLKRRAVVAALFVALCVLALLGIALHALGLTTKTTAAA
jgi:hypothetical protein